MRSDEPESELEPEGSVETEAADNGLTQIELEVELRQSIGRQLHEVLTRPTAELKAEKSRGE